MRDFYRPQPMAADSTFHVSGIHIFGFLATVAGNITVTASDQASTVLLDAMPVVVGFNRLAILLPTSDGADVTLAGSAAGALLL